MTQPLNFHVPEQSHYVRGRHLGSGDETMLTYCHACSSDYCNCQPGTTVRGEAEIEQSDEA
jgi:hypothetical protein